MCGIVGYIGTKDVKDIIITGLKTLEYRGYDSAGLALVNNDGIKVFREVGRIVNLENSLDNTSAYTGIGHTRWATHGKPTIPNAHPHTSTNNIITLVHNGIIENYLELKEELLTQGYTFKGETDTEVVANLLEREYLKTKDMRQAIVSMMNIVHGSYAFGIICSDNIDELYCAKNKSPMLAGIGEGFNMIGSDVMAMFKETTTFKEINDEEFLVVTKEKLTIYNKNNEEVIRDSFESSVNADDVNLGAYSHYMMKEIDEQPSVIRKLIKQYTNEEEMLIDPKIISELNNADRLYVIASGTSMHAGLVGKQIIEKLTKKPVEVHLGSEFGYNIPLISEKPLFIFITQSGETADSRAALKEVKKMNHKTLTITNVEGSTLSREADYTILLHAGPEIAVASTKAYVAQVTCLSIIANAMATKENRLNIAYELSVVANAIESVIDRKLEIKKIVEDKIVKSRNCFYIGRILDYYVSLEAALKLKEISYIQTEGFAAGELKHGTIALIESNTPVVGIISQSNVALNTRSAIQEVSARDALTTIISMKSLSNDGDDFIVDDVHELLSPIAMVVPTQLISYYAALIKDLDIDKPRNLAKSVTVE